MDRMKKDLMILAVAGAIAWFLLRKTGAAGSTGAPVIGANFAPTPTASDQGFGTLTATWEGWRYYDSGYAKDPKGGIYYQGLRIA